MATFSSTNSTCVNYANKFTNYYFPTIEFFFQFCYFILIMHMSVLCLPCFLFHDISLWLSLSLTLCCTLQIFFKLNCELVSHSCTKLCRTVIQMVILYYYNIIVIIGKCLFILFDLQYLLLSSFYIFSYYVYYVPICQSKFLVSENLLGIKTNSDSHCLHLFSVFFFFCNCSPRVKCLHRIYWGVLCVGMCDCDCACICVVCV